MILAHTYLNCITEIEMTEIHMYSSREEILAASTEALLVLQKECWGDLERAMGDHDLAYRPTATLTIVEGELSRREREQAQSC